MSYLRVIPRDLFNEAKLLKCLGQLALLIHDRVKVPAGLKLSHDDSEIDGFDIQQSQYDGSLYVSNMELTCFGRVITLRSQYNSKDAFPMLFSLDENEGRLLNDDGTLSGDFVALCEACTEGRA